MADSPKTSAAGWCHDHDEAEPCPMCAIRQEVDTAVKVDRHPTKPGGHALCGVYPCTECA